MRNFLGQVPLSAIAAVAAIAIAIWLSPPVSRRLGTGRPVATLLLLCFGLILAATLVPTAAAFEEGASNGVCDTSRLGLAPIGELTAVTSSSLNVILFMPLGVAVGLLPRTRTNLAVALSAVLLTFAVETIQLLIPLLGRGCQTADIFDNLFGLVIGLTAGLMARSFVRG